MFERYVMDNGLTVVFDKMEHIRSVSFGIYVKSGSRNENMENNGISHFIEHMIFKGTNKRSAKKIAEEMDNIGGMINAYTAKEFTGFYAKVLDIHFDIGFDILADIVLNSSFNEEDIKREAQVISEEIDMYNDAPDDVVFDKLQSNVWSDNPMGYSIIGTKENISGFNREMLFDYYNKNYCADNMIISVAGSFDRDYVLDKIKAYFGGLKKTNSKQTAKAPVYKSCSVITNRDIEQVHLCMAFNGREIGHKERYSGSVVNTIFGGGMSSVLFQKIREEKGLAYTVYAYGNSFSDCGLFNIYAGMNPSQLEEVYKIIIEEINRLKAKGIDKTLLKNTKERLKSSILMGLEDSESRMTRMARNMLLCGEILTDEEIIQRIDEVNEASVKRYIDEVFDFNKLSISIVGKNDACDYSKILKDF